MLLFTAFVQEGTLYREEGENRKRDHSNPHHRDEDAEELCPCGLPLVSMGS
jgi:hypothetical protein